MIRFYKQYAYSIGKLMKLLIYMPCLNEEENIGNTINSLPTKLNGIDEIRVLVVDDGSTDSTTMIAKNANAQVISHGYNRGVGAAFQSAINYALEDGFDILVSIDADGQFNPAEISLLIDPILKNQADMVIGNRFHNGKPKNMPSFKYLGNQWISQIINFVSNKNFQDVSCGYRAYSYEALMRLNLFGNFTYTHETILSQVFKGTRVVEVPVWVQYDINRKSRVASSILRYAFQSSKIILRVLLDYRPMRFFGALGLFSFIIGSLFEFFLIGFYIINQRFTPYKSFGFIGLGFIIFGLLVFLIAFIADMINRVKMNQDKILYELRKTNYKK
ncbi:MAG: hypothetical protein CL609_12025 [Anaerolineaceae bacterium]|nr:hypothetical protein [Anaerolineaceae bacterium]